MLTYPRFKEKFYTDAIIESAFIDAYNMLACSEDDIDRLKNMCCELSNSHYRFVFDNCEHAFDELGLITSELYRYGYHGGLVCAMLTRECIDFIYKMVKENRND